MYSSPRLPSSSWSLPPSPDNFRLHPCLFLQRHGVFRGAERWAQTSSIPATSALHRWGSKAEPSTSTAEGCLAAAVVGRSRTYGRAHCDFQVAVPALCFRGRPGAALDVSEVSCVGRARLAKADGHTFGSAILAHKAPIVVARCRVVRSSLEIDTASVHTADGSSKFFGHGYK